MPLYLCALREILPAPTITLSNGLLKQLEYDLPHTLVKKDKYLKYHSVKELDTPYFFAERKIYRLADRVCDLFYWHDKLRWCLELGSERRIMPFAKLAGESSINTMFADDCTTLSHEFCEWDAYIENESRDDPNVYSIYQKFHAATDFAKKNGALWYFQWDEERLDEYFEAKKWYPAHAL